MCKGCGAKIAQILLFIINFIVWVVGIVLIGVGAYAMVEASKYSVIFGDEDTLTSVAGFTVGVGVIIFLIGFFGCCGAFKKNGCLLKIYFAFVLLIILLEVIAGILSFVYKDDLIDAVEDGILHSIEEYNGDQKNAFVQAVDELQEQFDCCGANGPKDWDMANNTFTGFPKSCCVDANTDCNAGPYTSSNIKQDGCVEGMQTWVEGNYLMVGGVCIGLLVFEVLALVFACCLIRAEDDD